MFLYDILQQRGWSPADDLGRIKLIVSEGFPRGSVTVPVERVKNVAAFAFQHAPLCKLTLTPEIGLQAHKLHHSDPRGCRPRMAEPVTLVALTRPLL